MMNWQSFDQFLQMGGYGLYVWGSYGMTLLVLVAEVLAVRQRQRKAFDAVRSGAGREDLL